MGKEGGSYSLGCNRGKICKALPEQYWSSGKTSEDGAWIATYTEAAGFF